MSLGTCQSCDPSCIVCNGPSNSNCIQCSTSYAMYLGQCVAVCPSGFISVNGNCIACNSSCVTCSLSANYCTSCQPNYILANGMCSLPNITCPSGQYYDIALSHCQSCDASCLNCSALGYSNCLACNAGFTFVNGQCVSNCNSTSYYSNSSNNCQNCSSTCLTCNSSSNCLSCPTGKFLLNGQCQVACPVSYYNYGQVCYPCGGNCSTCTSAIQCTICNTTFVLYQGNCYSACPIRTFLLPSGTECGDCSTNCL
jgi:proprotein convertase subtilisin/kexin type 5